MIGSSHLNHRVGAGDEAVSQKKGGVASGPNSSLSVECSWNAVMSPRSYGGFSQMVLSIFAEAPSLLPRYIHRSPWGWVMGKIRVRTHEMLSLTSPIWPQGSVTSYRPLHAFYVPSTLHT